MPTPRMTTAEAIAVASEHLKGLTNHVFDLLTVAKPLSPDAAVNLSKVISKLSPLLGNMIEFNSVEFLNEKPEFQELGTWARQDPGFPDTVFNSPHVTPTPGFEIKAWFPLATEMTARFKDSQNHFADNNTYVCMLAWLPEHLIYGEPYIVDVVVVPGKTVAKFRDDHYHNPPDYIVQEPEDTASRTSNLRQTNTSGHKFQGTPEQFAEAERIVASWGPKGREYQPTREYQDKLRELTNRFKYRLDTNYGKMDRIVHPQLEEFKKQVNNRPVHGMTIGKWEKLFRMPSLSEKLLEEGSEAELEKVLVKRQKKEQEIRAALQKHLGIRDEDAEEVVHQKSLL